MLHRVVPAVAVLTLVVAACGDDSGSDRTQSTDTVSTNTAPASTPTAAATDRSTGGDPEALAVADLAAHIGVDPAEIDVVAHDQVTWRDGSMGCPKPSEEYIQMLVEGYRMVLRADSEKFFYHGAEGEPPFRCDDPHPDGAVEDGAAGSSASPSATSQTPRPTAGAADDATAGRSTRPPAQPPKEDDVKDSDSPVAQAVADLADQSGVDPDEVDVVAHDQVTWRDGSLGCPQPGMMYTQALVEGYRIALRVHGKQVFYHGARGKPPFRCDNPDPGGAAR